MTPISHVGPASSDPLGASAPAPSLIESGLRVAPGLIAPRASPLPEVGTMSPAVSNLADARPLAGAAETPRSQAPRPWALPLAIAALIVSAVGMFFVGRVVFRPSGALTNAAAGPATGVATGSPPSVSGPSSKGAGTQVDVGPTASTHVGPSAATAATAAAIATATASTLRGQPSPTSAASPPVAAPASAPRPTAAVRVPTAPSDGIHRQR
jgi:hypothetical protein